MWGWHGEAPAHRAMRLLSDLRTRRMAVMLAFMSRCCARSESWEDGAGAGWRWSEITDRLKDGGREDTNRRRPSR